MIQGIRYRIVRNILGKNNELLYRFCKKYVNDFNGDNNFDMIRNGEINFLKRNLRNGDIVFDVGAHVGNWSKLALDINNEITLHCFEPSKYTFQKLVDNNFPSNVYRNKFGLGSKKESKTMYIFDDGSGTNSLYQRRGLEGYGLATQQEKEQVFIDTLDIYCTERNVSEIDFQKIDVEGHEFEVLKGAINMLEKEKIKIIQFEYGGTYIDAGVFLKDIFKFFENLNYNFYKIFPENIKYIERYDQRLDNFQYQNYLLIREGHNYL